MPHLVLLIGAVVAVWWLFGRASARTRDRSDPPPPRRQQEQQPRAKAGSAAGARPIEDMVPCPRCGAYIAAGDKHVCEAKG